ncbi:MAG: ribosome maturation factor RimM [Lactobacillales bacterium]|jgi:16S rRNA processing protein RimM|nr:ribosome maturation factor RimM [Lactobacillales bacterium]
MSKLVCVGQIVNVHGIKGTVKVKPYLINPMGIAGFGPLTDKSGSKNFSIKVIGRQKECLLISIKGIETRDEAEKLKGMELYTDKSNLPKPGHNEFYHADLIGLNVFQDGKEFGVVKTVENFGAGDILEIALKNGQVIPFAFSNQNFPHIDVEKGTIEIVIPNGMEGAIHED